MAPSEAEARAAILQHPSHPSALDLGSADVSEAHSLWSTNCPIHRMPQEKQRKTPPQQQRIPKPRGAHAEECGQEGARQATGKCIRQVAPAGRAGRQGSARGPPAGTCSLRRGPRRAAPGVSPREDVAQAPPSPAAARPLLRPRGRPAQWEVPPSSHQPDKQHPTLACPRMKSVSVVRDQEHRDPE